MSAQQIAPGDVIQIDPEHDRNFGGCFMLVEEVKTWGYLGFVGVPGTPRGVAYYRVPKEGCAFIGQAVWMPEGTL